MTPVAAAEEIVGALPEGVAQLEVIAGAGHFTWLDAPDRFWPIIIEFVQRTTDAHPSRRSRRAIRIDHGSDSPPPVGEEAEADARASRRPC